MGRSRAATKQVDDREPAQLLNEVAGVVTLAAALFALVSFLSFQHGQTKVNLGGPVGYGLASGLMQAFGLSVYLLPIMLSILGTRLFRSRLNDLSPARAVAAGLLLLILSVILGLVLPQVDVVRAGGWFGGFVGSVLRDACGALGAYVVAAMLFLLALMFTTGTSVRSGAASGILHEPWARNAQRLDGPGIQRPHLGRSEDWLHRYLPRAVATRSAH